MLELRNVIASRGALELRSDDAIRDPVELREEAASREEGELRIPPATLFAAERRLIPMSDYETELEAYDHIDSLMDDVEDTAEKLAEDHYESCYNEEICTTCVDDTPISGEWGPWTGEKREFDGFVEAVEERVRDLGDNHPGWVQSRLSDTYLDAFNGAAVDPEDCVVCNREIIDEDEECGHEQLGRECPVKA